MKILYFYCGEGLGHATRTIAAGKALKKKHEVIFASYGYAREFGINSGLKVENVPSEIRLVGKGGKFSLSRSVLTTIRHIKPTAILKYRKLIKKTSPDLVISDSFIVPAMLAERKKIPTWIILNQTSLDVFFSRHKNPLLKAVGKAVKKFNYKALKKADKILVCDFAPPNTICAESLNFTKEMQKKVFYTGPILREECKKAKPKTEKKRVFSAIGGFGYRKKLMEKILNASKLLPEYKFDLVAGPNAKIQSTNKKVKTYGALSNPFPLMAKSSLAIIGGGHSFIMESLCMGKPILSAPDMEHFEQESNANGIERQGLGIRISYNTTEEELAQMIRSLTTSKKYAKKLTKIQNLSKKQDGAQKILFMAQELEKKLNL